MPAAHPVKARRKAVALARSKEEPAAQLAAEGRRIYVDGLHALASCSFGRRSARPP